MTCLESLYRMLEPLRVYALRRGSLVDRELAAYAAGFSLLDDALEEIRRQAFVQTATGDGLLMHEKLVGLQERGGVSDEDRRKLVLYRLSVAPYDFNLRGMVNSVRAAGMDAEIIENMSDESLTLVSKRLIDGFSDMDAIRDSVERMLPSHLWAEFDVGVMTWDMFDDSEVSWDDWDAKNFTWMAFDLDGHSLLTERE